MEKELKEIYECPTMEVVELKLESVILNTSGGDYPSGWDNLDI